MKLLEIQTGKIFIFSSGVLHASNMYQVPIYLNEDSRFTRHSDSYNVSKIPYRDYNVTQMRVK